MYKQIPAYEPDHSGYEEVDPDDQCEDCQRKYRHCECGNTLEDLPEQDETKPVSFYDRYGFDERDGPSPEEEHGYDDDTPNRWW